MTEVRRGDTWHVAYGEQGVYPRLAPGVNGVTIPTSTAKEILEAMKELLDG